MTQQEQFEADYLAAFELSEEDRPIADAHGQYLDDAHQVAYEVWLQQAKRHEEEIAELVAALNSLVENAEGFSVSGVYFNELAENRKVLDDAYDAIAKYEVKSS